MQSVKDSWQTPLSKRPANAFLSRRSSEPRGAASSGGSKPLGGYLPLSGESIGTENNNEARTRTVAQLFYRSGEVVFRCVSPLCLKKFDSSRGG